MQIINEGYWEAGDNSEYTTEALQELAFGAIITSDVGGEDSADDNADDWTGKSENNVIYCCYILTCSQNGNHVS